MELAVWKEDNSIAEIKKVFAPKLNESEWQMFLALGKATGLNPFLKEVWCIKYNDREAASIFISRDGYRKSAQSQVDYDYHNVDAVYSNDKFSVINGEINHEYQVKDRGQLVGAYCVVKRKTSSKSQFCYVEAKEYLKYQSVWKEKPATMIKKVAEAQCLRMVFQNVFVGTYSEFEQWKREEIIESQQEIKRKESIIVEPISLSFETDDVLKILQDVNICKDLEELKEIWKSNEQFVLNLSPDEKKPILHHFNERKKQFKNES